MPQSSGFRELLQRFTVVKHGDLRTSLENPVTTPIDRVYTKSQTRYISRRVQAVCLSNPVKYQLHELSSTIATSSHSEVERHSEE